MPFAKDDALAQEAEQFFGTYKMTFHSENEQVRADLFEKGGKLRAYVSFSPGYDASNVTDPWAGELSRWAKENHFGDDVTIVYQE